MALSKAVSRSGGAPECRNIPVNRSAHGPVTVVLFHSMVGLRPVELSAAERLRTAGHRVRTPDLFAVIGTFPLAAISSCPLATSFVAQRDCCGGSGRLIRSVRAPGQGRSSAEGFVSVVP